MKKVVVMDRHIANLGLQAGMGDEWPELFCDEEFIAMVTKHYKEAYLYLTKKYGKGN